ncbi:PAS domain-containing sensor histidine kinase [Halorientalis halophila]|uniref:PAS domain-containing sensor histidine kinase n=1 Tax=Halorientalis halophila TaxID=3108499 RepID=UPI003008E76A
MDQHEVDEQTGPASEGRPARDRRLEAVFEATGTFIGVLDPYGTILRVNKVAREFAAVEPSTYVGGPFWEGPWFEHDDALQERIRAAIERAGEGEDVEFEATQISPDGEQIDIDGTVSPVTDEDGRVESLVAQGIDVTEQRRREERLAAQRERMNTLLNNAPVVLFALDPDGEFTYSRGNALDKLGLEPGEAVGQSVFEMFAEAPDVIDAVERALEGERVETQAQQGDLYFHTVYQPVFDDRGELEQVIGISRDVTELRERERELEAWTDRLQTVLDNVPLALWTADTDGMIEMSQGQGLAGIGVEPGELEGQNMFEVFAGQEAFLSDFEAATAGEEHTAVHDIGPVIARTWYRPIVRDGAVEKVIGVSIDITDEKRQERRIEAVNEATSELIAAESQRAVADIVMTLATELLDMPLSGIYATDDGSDDLVPVAATDRVQTMMDAETPTEALPNVTPGSVEMETFRTGSARVVEDYATLENSEMPDSPLGTLVIVPLGEYGQLHVGTPEVSVPTEAELNIIEILARNAEAALERAEREAELEAYRAELEQSNERLQEFAHIASHDLQEPLRMVSSYVDLLAVEYGDELDDEADEYIDFAVGGANRMQSMIEDLLQYSRVSTDADEFETVDAAAVVEETIQSLEFAIDDADATVDVEPLPTVEADRDQLGQVIQNLVSNALSHAGESPTVTVRATEADDHYRFEVADDGPGIPENQRERIFKLFQQGSRDGDGGTGIGLAVCDRIVSRHGGDIWIESEEGVGATFCFTIPKRGETEDRLAAVAGGDAR